MKLRLQITVSAGAAFAFEHAGPRLRIGRDSACELALHGDEFDSVSWNHAQIELSARGAALTDAQSKNGTYVNERRITEQTSIQVGDDIRLGKKGPRLTVVELDLGPPLSELSASAQPSLEAPAERALAAAQRKPVLARPPAAARTGRRRRWIGAAVAGLCLLAITIGTFVFRGQPARTPAGPDPAKLAEQARAILEKNCYRCHGQDGSNEGRMNFILNRQALVEKKKVVPGDPEQSRLYRKVKAGAMPPDEEQPRPSASDIDVLRQWIAAGAPPFARDEYAVRPIEQYVLSAIRTHLGQVPSDQRVFQRYFILTHLHRNPKVPKADLRIYQAAVSKLLNSMSWQSEIAVPTVIGADKSILAVDLRHIGWEQHQAWNDLLRSYPYGLRCDHDPDETVQQLAREVYDRTGTVQPFVRADWFVANAARPPLYHSLLRLPRHATELERDLHVDVPRNIQAERLVRAGFTSSGVSSQNRLVERHEARYGAYWKSYDFKPNQGRSNLFQFPLGPSFAGNEFSDLAFEHDGGEIIFNLPNGLQGYLLVDGKDNRIDAGPIEVVRDSRQTSGTPVIVNGLSCMACHEHGMIRGFKDTVRGGTGVSPAARVKVQKLYPEAATMDKLLEQDEQRFRQALAKATGSFASEDREPIGLVARTHVNKELGLSDAAAELGLTQPAQLKAAIQNNNRLRALGLGPLADGNTIKREAWESLRSTLSPFQEAARELGLGEPVPAQPK